MSGRVRWLTRTARPTMQAVPQCARVRRYPARAVLDAEVLWRSLEFDSRMAGIVNINQY